MYELNDLKVLIKSKTPIVVIETHEEARVLELFTQLVIEFPRPLFKWAVTEGLQRIDLTDMPPQAFNKEPLEALKHIRSCLLYTSPSPRDLSTSRMPSSA